MSTDPGPHRRRSIRLRDYDYAHNGAYFVTICTHDRDYLFGEVINGAMRLNEFGGVAEACWQAIPDHFPFVELDAHVVMPNHFHGILVILEHPGNSPQTNSAVPLSDAPHHPRSVGARHALPLPNEPTSLPRVFGKPPAQSLHSIVGSFKSAVSRQINLIRRTPGCPVWQRNYYEYIIRDLTDLDILRTYIDANPARWSEDRYYAR